MRTSYGWIIGLACLVLLGCNLTRTTGDTTPEPDTDGWQTLAPGIEQRRMEFEADSFSIGAVLVRLDPSQVVFRVHYSPDQPRSMADWQAVLPDASIIVNGGFFDEAEQALGLLVSDGQPFGSSFVGVGGMFQVSESGVRVRSLVTEPYQGEALTQAVQAFPMLIESGGVLARQGEGFDRRARRTAIGQDRQGRIIVVIVPLDSISLAELQQTLFTRELDLAIAFALDGGRSTGLVINTPAKNEVYWSFDQLPSVIAAYPL